MSRSKYRAYTKKPYESDLSPSDTSANIYHSMRMSAAWKALSAQQRDLYGVCKDQVYAQRTKQKPDPTNDEKFYMNQGLWADKYELYKKNNYAGFKRDMNALIDHGFIVCLENGCFSRTKSVFQFSPMWKKWGQPDFFVHPNFRLIDRPRRPKVESDIDEG